jgi:hypothetical protein
MATAGLSWRCQTACRKPAVSTCQLPMCTAQHRNTSPRAMYSYVSSWCNGLCGSPLASAHALRCLTATPASCVLPCAAEVLSSTLDTMSIISGLLLAVSLAYLYDYPGDAFHVRFTPYAAEDGNLPCSHDALHTRHDATRAATLRLTAVGMISITHNDYCTGGTRPAWVQHRSAAGRRRHQAAAGFRDRQVLICRPLPVPAAYRIQHWLGWATPCGFPPTVSRAPRPAGDAQQGCAQRLLQHRAGASMGGGQRAVVGACDVSSG